MSSLSTPINELLGDEQAPPHMMQRDPSSQFAQPPHAGGGYPDMNPVTNEIPHGASQGMSMPRRELFGSIKGFDWKSSLLVFAIVFIVTSSTFLHGIQAIGGNGSDGKITFVGSAIAAFVALIIFVLVKMIAKI